MEREKETPHPFPEDKNQQNFQQKAEILFSEEASGEHGKKKTGAAAFLLQGIYRKLGVILLIVIALVVFFGGLRLGKMIYGTSLTNEKVQVTDTLLYQQLQQENELATVKYFYTNMGKYENSLQVGNANIPFTKKSFIIAYDGVIKAGIDMDKVKIGVEGKKITIVLPEAEILSHETDMDSVQVYDEKNSIFNGLSTEDVTNFQKEQKAVMEERAIGSGMLEEAQRNAEKSLRSLYEAFLGREGYEDGYTLEIIKNMEQ